MTGQTWITLLGIVVAATTAIFLADALTVKGRLRRRLEKQVTLADKMPAGLLKVENADRARRLAAELSIREAGWTATGWWAVVLTAAVFSWGNAFIAFRVRAADPTVQLDPVMDLWGYAAPVMIIIAIWGWTRERTRLRVLVDQKVEVDAAQLPDATTPDLRAQTEPFSPDSAGGNPTK